MTYGEMLDSMILQMRREGKSCEEIEAALDRIGEALDSREEILRRAQRN